MEFFLFLIYNKGKITCGKERLYMKKLLFAATLLTVFSGAYSAQALIPGVPVLETEVGYGYNGAKDGIQTLESWRK